MAISLKSDHPEIASELLNDSRKIISQRMRHKIAGGDFL